MKAFAKCINVNITSLPIKKLHRTATGKLILFHEGSLSESEARRRRKVFSNNINYDTDKWHRSVIF